MNDQILLTAKKLYDQGFAIHWLHPQSKRPVESGWTTGPRKKWEYLKATYRKGYNVGTRLGAPSKVDGGYLMVVDVDVKSKDPRHLEEALAAARKVLKTGGTSHIDVPIVSSGFGNGSRHYYAVTPESFPTFNAAVSNEKVKALVPSKKPSKRERELLTAKEIDAGVRLVDAWQVSLYSDGRQVVLPPSIHPDTKQEYVWKRTLEEIGGVPKLLELPDRPEAKGAHDEVTNGKAPSPDKSLQTKSKPGLGDFIPTKVEIDWLPISKSVIAAIKDGTGVSDRSGYLLKAATALVSAGLDQNEVLSVLTDPKTFLGACAYEHAQTKDRRRAMAWVHRYTFQKVHAERSASVFAKVPWTDDVATPEERKAIAEDVQKSRSWKQDIVRNDNGKPAKIVQNVVLILKEAVAADVVRRDEFAYRDTYACDTPWGAKANDVVTDDDVAGIKFWLGVNYQFEPSTNTIADALVVVARENSYDPVKDFLAELPKWDGVQRLDTWLVDNFEAEGDPEYLAQVFRKWMVAMVMRAYVPGAKFDWMPIFEGKQGIGKSSFGRLLVGDRYFLDWLPALHDKDSSLGLQGMWGVELGELSQFRRTELEGIKNFLTRSIDKMRPPYGRRMIESPRRCVFFGTTNKTKFLIDDTGNRRFKPLLVGRLDFRALKKDRLQLFAEAKYLWRQRIETERTMELTGAARVYEQKIHHEKMVEDDSHSMEEAMKDFIEKVDKNGAGFDLSKFKVLDLFSGVGPLGGWRKENRNLQFAAKMLKRLGAESRFINGRKHWKLPDSMSGGGLGDGTHPPVS